MNNIKTVRILFGIILIIGVSIVAPVISKASRHAKEKKIYEPIIRYILYNNYQKLSASASAIAEYNNSSTKYILLHYKDYANSLCEFVGKYPTFTIKTRGEAISDLTFGNVGRDKFGALTYSTYTFINNNVSVFSNVLYAKDEELLAYNVCVNIGIAFRRRDDKLVLFPYIDGSLLSHGDYERYLDFGITIETVTFNPDNEKKYLNNYLCENKLYHSNNI